MRNIFIYLLLALQLICLKSFSQPTLFGITSDGGDGFGTIYGVPTGSTGMSHNFKLTGYAGINPANHILQASNGKLYCLIGGGGAFSQGVLCEYDIINNIYIKKIDFEKNTNGQFPVGALIEATNGKLYGSCVKGGINNQGTIFEYDITSGILTKKIDINAAVGGTISSSLFQASNGKLYGLTFGGGVSGLGTLFEYDITSNTYTPKINFNGTNGSSPQNCSLFEANNGKLYGFTSAGGVNNLGTLFEYDFNTNTLVKKVDFNGIANGSTPIGSLFQASNGKLYGLTAIGGTTSNGTLFEYDIVSGVCTKKIDFNGSGNGRNIQGGLTEITGGKLYGTAVYGGVNDQGTIFEYDMASSVLVKKHDFTKATGKHPFYGVLKLNSGELVGITLAGGLDDKGVIFKYDPLLNSYQSKIHLSVSNGGNVICGPLLKTSTGKIYGMTFKGGIKNGGVIFEFDPYTNTYVKKIDLDTLKGIFPYGSLMEASNGKIYGVTKGGGTMMVGALFEYDYGTNTYSKKYDFDFNPVGREPVGTLVEGLPGKLYGMVTSGALSAPGIFEYDISSSTYTMKFPITLAASISTSLIKASNNRLYGLSSSGGTNNKGFLFEYTPSTNTFIKKIDFDGSGIGSTPSANLCEAANGKLYGTTANGGTSNMGVLFEYDTLTSTLIKKMDFTTINVGVYPQTTLLKASNGKLYGTTASNSVDAGVVFEYDNVTNTYTKKVDFDWYNGRNYGLDASLIEICLVPATPSFVTGLNALCVGTSSNASFSIPVLSTATSYSWNLPSGASILTGGGTNNITADVSSLSPGTYTVSVAGVNVCGAGNSFTQTITVSSSLSPTVSATSSNSVLCIGQTATINANGANTYTWSSGPTGNSIVVSPTVTTNYTVTGTDINGCQNSSIFTQSVSICSGMNEYDNNEVRIYPNPVRDELLIESSFIGKLQVYDVAGKIVYTQNMEAHSMKINIKDLAGGIYYLKISSDSKSELKKLIKQ